MTMAEKLAAARGGAASAPAAGSAGAKPAAAKAALAAKPAAARAIPPLDKITDPKDLAEAACQAAAKRAKEEAAAKAAAAPPKAKPAPAKPQTVPPRPGRELAAAGSEPRGIRPPRVLSSAVSSCSWLAVAWTTFTAGMAAMTTDDRPVHVPERPRGATEHDQGRPPLELRTRGGQRAVQGGVGLRVVRSTRYNGTDIICAIQSVCTHLGCPPNWLASEQKFKCPCHGSGFYISGINFEGPAPRPLERFKVALADDGQIMVDKSQKFQEELGQWADPDSFIPA